MSLDKRYKNWMANALVAMGSVLFILVIGEIALRGVKMYQDMRFDRKMCRLSANPEIGYELIPGYSGLKFSVNSHGFRGPEFDPVKKPGVFRIVVLGDSITFGPNRAEDQLYVRILERKLNDGARKDVRYEVLNAGVGGYNTWQELGVYKQKARALKPDLMILAVCQNDFVRHGKLYTDMFGIVHGDLETEDEGGLDNLFVFKKAKQAIKLAGMSLAGEGEARKSLIASAPTLTRLWSDGEKPLSELSLTLKTDGVKSLFVIFPYKFQLEEDDYRSSDERFMRFCEEAGQPCLDLFGNFKSRGGDLYARNDHIHLNNDGNALAAEAIYSRLKESGIVE